MALRGRTAVLSHAMEGDDRRTRGAPLVAIAAYAGTVAAACELAFVLAAAGAEARSIAFAACAAAALAIAASVAVGSLAALVLRDAAVAAFGVPFAVLDLFALANGGFPGVEERAIPAWLAGAVAIAALALGASVRRFIPPRRTDLAKGAERASGRAILAAPPLVAGLGFGMMLAALRLGASPGGRVGWTAGAAGALAGAAIAVALLRRSSDPNAPLLARLAWIGAGAAALAVAAAGLVLRFEPPTPTARAGGKPDVLLIVLDTVRADAAPAPDGAPLPTPALARLAREGTRFTNAFSTSCWTLTAHASIFTGLTAREHGTGWQDPYLPADFPTVAERFARSGYRTAGFSANVWVSPEFGLDRGFDRFTTLSAADRPPAPWALRLVPSLFASLDAALPFDDKGGSSLASAALRFLAARDDRPAFVFLNLLEAHMPYAPPERWLRRIAGRSWSRRELLDVSQSPLQGLLPGTVPGARQIEGLRALYGAEVAYDDEILGRILEALRASGRLDGTIVAVLSDHGENLGDHPPLDHQLGLWDSLIHVPLIFRAPARLPAGTARDELVSLADIPAALEDLAGIGAQGRRDPIDGLEPRIAVDFSYDRPGEVLDRIRAQLGIDPAPWDRRLDGIRSRATKWIVGSDGTAYAFDLTRDPGETSNLAGAATHGSAPVLPPSGFESLSSLLAQENAATPLREPRKRTMSDDARRQLRSLGYVH